MEEERLNRRLVIEKPMPEVKKKKSLLPAVLFILILCAAAFYVLEKLHYIDFVDFI